MSWDEGQQLICLGSNHFFHEVDLGALIIRGRVRSEDLGGGPYDTIAEREGASRSMISSLMWIMSSERIQNMIAMISIGAGDLMMLKRNLQKGRLNDVRSLHFQLLRVLPDSESNYALKPVASMWAKDNS